MNEQSTTDPQTGLDKVFAALRGIGVRRRSDDKWIGGVCSGLADRLGVDPVIVRAAFVLLSILGGVGVSVYLVAWALLPDDQDQIAAERALVHGDSGSVVLLVVAALSVFGGSWWGRGSGWGFPWGLVLTSLLIWWLIQRSRNRPDADRRVSAQRSGTPYAGGPSPTAAGPWQSPSVPSPAAARPVFPRKPRRRSGGPLMAALAIGLALVTYGSLSWLGTEFNWPGDHLAIAMAGSLAAMGLLLVGLGLAGWRAGFVAFLAVVLAITALSSTVVPTGIHAGGPVGDATWAPTSVTAGANYHLGAGNAVLDLGGLATKGLSQARLPASVGLGDLKVLVPQGLSVKVVGHVGLGEILLPADAGNSGQGGTDVARSVVIGQGPTEVVVDAGVGVGQLTVVKE
jgi:phage shock protein PspC (stress-responsive transcriptional regulator)